MNLSIADILAATGGTLLAGTADARVQAVTIDSRTAGPGSLFVPLRGTRADGHDFIGSAFAQGAAAALTEQAGAMSIERFPGRVLVGVACALRALGDIAARWRRMFSLPVIAVTGSNGKTTTKEMAATVISRSRTCLKNEGNYNNLIGLPLSVLKLRAEHQLAVFEMGMSAPGEIRRLAEICRPDIGVITNVGPCHLEQLGSLETVAAAKGELFDALGSGDCAVVNRDDERVRALGAATAARVITYGMTAGDVHAAQVCMDRSGAYAFDLYVEGRCAPVMLGLPGAHFVLNALAASAAAHAAGIGVDEIAAGLCACAPVCGRMQRLELNGLHIINDAYNANPVSMRAALTSLAEGSAGRRTIAVLGDMLELGEYAAVYHREIGTHIARLGIDFVFVLGSFAGLVYEAACSAGMPAEHIRVYETLPDLAAALAENAVPGDMVLLKGSRGMQLENVIELLTSVGSDT